MNKSRIKGKSELEIFAMRALLFKLINYKKAFLEHNAVELLQNKYI